MVKLESISKSFADKTVIRDFSLTIESGERFILLGRSGCGKTTLLRILAGFEHPDRGTIRIDGDPVGSLPVERRPVGFIFQTHALFPHMTVYDNIAVGPRVRQVPEPEIAGRIEELLKITRLEGLRDAWPRRLSGGESQRVALARAIINQPRILLLDEPLSALEPSLRQSLREELVEMQKALDITFLFVTHDQEEAMSLATRMGILEDGHLLQVGTPADLYKRPNSPFVAGFLGDVNRLAGSVEDHAQNRVRILLDGGDRIESVSESAFDPGQRVTCFIRPENMRFAADASLPTLNCLEGTVISKSFFGSCTRYKVQLKAGAVLQVPVQHGSGETPATGFEKADRVRVVFAVEDVLLFPETHNGS